MKQSTLQDLKNELFANGRLSTSDVDKFQLPFCIGFTLPWLLERCSSWGLYISRIKK